MTTSRTTFKPILVALPLVMSLLTLTGARAALIDNSQVTADTFIDTRTNLVWLDPSLTGSLYAESSDSGIVEFEVLRTINENLDLFPDFRMATESEARGLVNSIFGSLSFSPTGNYLASDSWSRSSGGERIQPDPQFLDGYDSLASVINVPTFRINYNFSDFPRAGFSHAIDGVFQSGENSFGRLEVALESYTEFQDDSSGSPIASIERYEASIAFIGIVSPFSLDQSAGSVWMVQNTVSSTTDAEADISEPMTFSLVGLALAGFGFIRNKRRPLA